MDSLTEINYLLKHSKLSSMGRRQDSEKVVLSQIKYKTRQDFIQLWNIWNNQILKPVPIFQISEKCTWRSFDMLSVLGYFIGFYSNN